MKSTLTAATLIALMGSADAATTFSTNLFAYGRGLATEWNQESWREQVRIDPTDADQSAGVWDTTAWENLGATTGAAVLTADDGLTTANWQLNNARNAAPYWWTGVDPDGAGPLDKVARDDSSAVDVGNATLLDGHGNGTFYDGANGSGAVFPAKIYDFQINNIPFAEYNVIVYIGVSAGQEYNGTGRIRVNNEIPLDTSDATGGTNFVRPAGAPDGTLDEITSDGDTGNYIVYSGLTDSTFRAQVYGIGSGIENFTHIGPAGIQIQEVPEPGSIALLGLGGLLIARRRRD